MSIWSGRDFDAWHKYELGDEVWTMGDNGDSNGLANLAEKFLSDEQGEHIYRVSRSLGAEILRFTLSHPQLGTAIPAPAIEHVRNAALVSCAASVVPRRRGSLDHDLNDRTLLNIEWAENLMQKMHLSAIARLMEAVEASKGSTGF